MNVTEYILYFFKFILFDDLSSINLDYSKSINLEYLKFNI